jgi:hypothetical protein
MPAHRPDPDARPDTGDGLDDIPGAEALIAGMVGLATTWADPCPSCRMPPAERERLIARRMASTLFYLARHPSLSPALRDVMEQAHTRWLVVERRSTQAAAAASAAMEEVAEAAEAAPAAAAPPGAAAPPTLH